jgi:preprotein translocase subunit SecG
VWNFLIAILNVLVVLGSLFMICIILIQRGKGGGLAGAFGGVGGSSAFGTKAGDVFTRITIGVAIGWILTLMVLVFLTNRHTTSAFDVEATTSESKEFDAASTKAKSNVPAPDLGADQPAPQIPMLPPDTSVPAPPVDIPAIPDTQSTAPAATPNPSAPASTPSPSSKPAPK